MEKNTTSTPGASPGVSFFIVQGRRDTEARQGFRAAGLHDGLSGRGEAARRECPGAAL
ncbi:MAG TPA: hypothetical protein VHQ22_21750 [Terriglobales bacterium]|nr:hypothetical protein [Terriglobales bacterium]